MFSIIIPVGPGRDARVALGSLTKANFRNGDEILLVGDGRIVEPSEEFSGLPVRVLSTPDQCGANAARNLGAAEAKHDLLCFLDDDDAYIPGALSQILEYISTPPQPSVLSLSWRMRSGRWQWFLRRPAVMRENNIRKRNFAGGCSSMVVPRSLFEQAGGFDEQMPSMQDWDLWLRLSRVAPIRTTREKLVVYHDHPGERISTNRAARIAGLSRLLDKNAANWPPRIVAFHKARLAGERFAAGEGPFRDILNPVAPVASLLFALKYSRP